MNDEIPLLGFEKYKEIVNRLIEINVLEVDNRRKNIYKKNIRLYKLNEKFYSDEGLKRVVYLRNSKLIKLLDKRYDREIKGDRLMEWEVFSCSKLSINEKGIEDITELRLNKKIKQNNKKKEWDFISNSKRKKLNKKLNEEDKILEKRNCKLSFELLKNGLEQLKHNNTYVDGFGRDSYGNRLYNIVNTKEKEFRGLMKINNNKVIEIDMINGYISLLNRIFLGIRNSHSNNKFDRKIKELVGDNNGNDFIEMYNEICFNENINKRIDFYNYVGAKLYGIKYGNRRDYIKELVTNILNGRVDFLEGKKLIDGKYDIKDLGEKIFGVKGFKCINKLKELDVVWKDEKSFYGYEKYKNLSKILMKMEVIIMTGLFNKLIDKKIHYISLFDGILVGNNKEQEVLGIMNSNIDLDKCIRFKSKTL